MTQTGFCEFLKIKVTDSAFLIINIEHTTEWSRNLNVRISAGQCVTELCPLDWTDIMTV